MKKQDDRRVRLTIEIAFVAIILAVAILVRAIAPDTTQSAHAAVVEQAR